MTVHYYDDTRFAREREKGTSMHNVAWVKETLFFEPNE